MRGASPRSTIPWGLVFGLGASLWSGPAEARSQLELAWAPRDVFNVAVRFVRVDRGCRISDKDPASGYVLFECDSEQGGKVTTRRGALELIEAEIQGRAGVRVQVTLDDEPRYMEARFLELLERKVRQERGAAPSNPPPRPTPPSAPDAGS